MSTQEEQEKELYDKVFSRDKDFTKDDRFSSKIIIIRETRYVYPRGHYRRKDRHENLVLSCIFVLTIAIIILSML